MNKTCQNCDFEYYCKHGDAHKCDQWRQDVEHNTQKQEETE